MWFPFAHTETLCKELLVHLLSKNVGPQIVDTLQDVKARTYSMFSDFLILSVKLVRCHSSMLGSFCWQSGHFLGCPQEHYLSGPLYLSRSSCLTLSLWDLKETRFPCPPNNLLETQMNLLCGQVTFTLHNDWKQIKIHRCTWSSVREKSMQNRQESRTQSCSMFILATCLIPWASLSLHVT